MQSAGVRLDMTRGPLGKKIFLFSVPIALTSILQLLFNACDIIVVGQFVNETAVAAVGSTTYLIGLITNFFIGLSIGATVVISTSTGAGRLDEVSRAAHTTVTIGIIFGLCAAVIGFFGSRTFLAMMSTPDDVIDQAALYLRIYFLGTPFFITYQFGRAVLITTGDTRRPMYYLTAAGILNVALNLLLVIVFDLGVAGVAIGTVASQLLSCILLILRLMKIDGPCHISLRKLGIDRKLFGKIMHMGLPTGIQTSLFSISNVLIQSSVNSLGTAYVAGNAASSNIEGFVWVSMDAFNQGAMTFTGQNYGAQKVERFNKILKISALQCALVGAAAGLAVILFRYPLLSIYLPRAHDSVELGAARLIIFMATYWTCGLMNVAAGCSRGLNRTFVPMIATLIGVCVMRVVWIFAGFGPVLSAFGSLTAYRSLVLSYPVTWVVTGLFLYWYYFRIRNGIASGRLS